MNSRRTLLWSGVLIVSAIMVWVAVMALHARADEVKPYSIVAKVMLGPQVFDQFRWNVGGPEGNGYFETEDACNVYKSNPDPIFMLQAASLNAQVNQMFGGAGHVDYICEQVVRGPARDI